MSDAICPRCFNKFSVAVPVMKVNCPFCGFSIKDADLIRRAEQRVVINKDCYLFRNELTISAQAVNISKKWAGVVMTGPMPFEKGDTLHIVIKDTEINSDAQIVWVQRFNNTVSRGGLLFC